MSIRGFLSRDVRMRHLRLLVAIDDAGRLTRAAQMLHITQPALSKALAEMEQSLGKPLFERLPQGLQPTPAGTILIRAARATLGELERASQELHRPATVSRRMLHVGSLPSGVGAILASAFARFRAALEAEGQADTVTFNVVDGQTPSLLALLVAGRLDLVLGSTGPRELPEEVEAIPLYEDRMRLVVPTGHPLARKRKAAWTQACQHPWVLQPTGHPTRIAFERSLRRLGYAMPPVVFEALPSDSGVTMILSLGAVGLLPGRLTQTLVAQGGLKAWGSGLDDQLAVALPVAAFVRRSAVSDLAVTRLIGCLQAS